MARVARAFLAWYETVARDLPWRRTRDPYALWISEIMLQQTQVKTVIPYWERWMRALPTLASLAAARESRVLKLWEGLGYYRRARHLHQAARVIMKSHGGGFPKDPHIVLSLPGIGRYTAGAICSLAYNLPTPIVDGNVIRVLTRVFGIEGDPKENPARKRLWALAEALVLRASRQAPLNPATTRRPAFLKTFGHCGNLNQALMELGATVCSPASPRCDACPLRTFCFARHHERQDSLPHAGRRERSVARRHVAFVLCHGNHLLIRQRPEGGVNARLWEFPCDEPRKGRPLSQCAAAWEMRLGDLEKWMTVRHSITRYRITLTAYRGEVLERKAPALRHGRWVTRRQLSSIPFTGAHRKLVEALLQGSAETRI